jgi:amidase
VRDYFCLTPAQNIIGNTAISLPMGMSHEGLPIGVQLSANRGDESTLLELSYELEGDGALRALEAPLAYGAGA